MTGKSSAADDDTTHSGSASQYFAESPTATSQRREVNLLLEDFGGQFITDAGVFARDRIDPGTKLLLGEGPAANPADQTIVDVGSGYGPIAVVIAKRNPQATVWAVDPNGRARELCELNAKACGAHNVRVIAPDQWPLQTPIDRIWSNPPIRIGKNALHDLLATWLPRLSPSGSAHLVVQKHLGADSLQRWLTAQGWPTSRRGSRAAYRLLDVEAASPQPTQTEAKQ